MRKNRWITDSEYLRGLRIVEASPANQSGADQTWVLHALRRLERLFRNARPASGNVTVDAEACKKRDVKVKKGRP